MGKFYIADQVNNSKTVDVLPSGAIETAEIYSYYYVPSATAAAAIYAGACLLHEVDVAGTAISHDSYLGLYNLADSTEVTATMVEGLQAAPSAVALIGTGVRKRYLFDALCDGSLVYRLSGITNGACPCITITYQVR
jgi:hypothetical protein